MTKKTMKVIAFNYLTDTPVTHILEVITRLQKKYEVELTLLNTSDKSNITKLANDVNIRQVPLTQYKVPFFKGLFFEIYIILHFLISKENIDIIYGRLRPFSFAEYVLWKLKKIPVVIEVNGILTEEILMEIKFPSFLNPLILKIVSFLEGKTLSVAKKVFAVTPNIKNRIQETYDIDEEKVFVIENGANTDLFKPIDKGKAKEKLHLTDENKYVTFIGNLAPWQGVEYLVKAAPMILKEIPDIKFLIVGDGAMREELQEMVDELNLHNSFIFTGMVPYEDVPLYVNAGELCVAYKIPIGSGYSALKFYEYMACGKPIVGSRVTGFEILEQYNAGVLVEPQNHERLAEALINLLKDEKLREQMGKNGREYLIENNSWDAVTQRIENILKDVFNEKIIDSQLLESPKDHLLSQNTVKDSLSNNINNSENTKKVLIISFFFNQNEIGSIRTQGLAKNLAKLGWEPTILTVKSDSHENYPFRVIETEYEDLRENWKKKLNLNPKKTVSDQLNSAKKNETGLADYIVKFWSDFYAYPDFEKNWYNYAVNAGFDLLEKESFDAIISSSSPVTCHLIANKLKNEHNIPWIADLRDLWTQNHYYLYSKIRKIIDRRLELNILKDADALTTVSPLLVKKLKELHKNENIFPIPNGFDPKNVNPGVSLTNKLSIIYSGRLYRGKRDPELLFKALKELNEEEKINLDDFRLDFYGKIQNWLKEDIKKYDIDKIVRLNGTVEREIAIEKQWESQLLLLLTWANPHEKGVLTGKIFEYLAAKRPILSYGVGKGSVKDLIDETNAGYHAQNYDDLKVILENFYKEFKFKGYIEYHGIEDAINRYSHEKMTKKFVNILETVAKTKKP